MQTPWGDVSVGDAHIHFFSRRFFASLGEPAQVAEKLGWELPGEDPAELAAKWVAELDAQGVARAALIASVPGDEASVVAARAAYPERFLAYAMVNPLAEGAAVAEGLNAISLFPAMHRYSVHDARVEPLLEQAQQRGCAVFVHCGVLTVGVRKKLGLASPFDMRFSNPIELHGVAMRYPGVKFVIPHFGAGYLREALMVADLCPNVYLDSSSSNSWMRYEGLDLRTVLRRTLDVAGASRVMFGSDSSFFPRGWVREVFDDQVRVLSDLGVSAADARAILGGNLAELFGRAAGAGF